MNDIIDLIPERLRRPYDDRKRKYNELRRTIVTKRGDIKPDRKSWLARTHIHWVMILSKSERKLRICRIIWSKGRPGDKRGGYSAMLSIGMIPRLFFFYGDDPHLKASRNHWRLCVLGLVLHHRKAFGGWLT